MPKNNNLSIWGAPAQINTHWLTKLILIVWIALLGADRIDLAGGNLSFSLSPFLFFTLILLFSLVLTGFQKPFYGYALHFDKNILYIYGFLVVTIIPSVILSNDFTLSLKRFFLLNFEFISILFILNRLTEFTDRNKIILSGAVLGLLIYIAFSIFEEVRWISGNLNIFGKYLKLDIVSFGPFAPRLSGLSNDPNRACLVLTNFFFIFLFINKESKSKYLLMISCSTLIILSLSKSGLLLLIVSILIYLLIAYNRKELIRLIIVSLVSVIFSWLILKFVDGVNFSTSNSERSFLTERFSIIPVPSVIIPFAVMPGSSAEVTRPLALTAKGIIPVPSVIIPFAVMPGSSADVHISLFKRAYEFSTDSPLNFLVGNGFQASQNLLKDYFPDNKYANFHSLYLTLIVESGFFSLIAILIFLAYPIIFKVSLRPILIGVVVFNIFYQSILDPVFWFIYLFGWMSINNKKE